MIIIIYYCFTCPPQFLDYELMKVRVFFFLSSLFSPPCPTEQCVTNVGCVIFSWKPFGVFLSSCDTQPRPRGRGSASARLWVWWSHLTTWTERGSILSPLMCRQWTPGGQRCHVSRSLPTTVFMVPFSKIFTNPSVKPRRLPLLNDQVAAGKPAAALDWTPFAPWSCRSIAHGCSGATVLNYLFTVCALPLSRHPSCYFMGLTVSVEWSTCWIFTWIQFCVCVYLS